MCKVYNTIGSLTTIKTRLTQNKIDGFNSLAEIQSFHDNYATARQQIISNHEAILAEERNNLSSEILRLENEISISKLEVEQKLKTELEILSQKIDQVSGMEKSLIGEVTYSFVVVFLMLKIKYKELSYEPSPTHSPTRLSSRGHVRGLQGTNDPAEEPASVATKWIFG